MVKLSIIIPIYNVENYLPACLDSVLTPGLEGYEVVAVNDGSTDRSGEILSDYARRFPGLLYPVTTLNGGLGRARNVGLALARGEYVQFLDSDDTLTPGAVAEMLQALDDSFDVGVFDFVTVNEQGQVLKEQSGANRAGSFTLEEYPELLFDPPNAVNKLWKRDLFQKNGLCFPDRMWFEDLATVPRVYLKAGRFQHIEKSWYRYLQRQGSITNSADARRNLDMLKAVDMTLSYYREQGAYEHFEPQLCYMAAYHELLTSTTRVNLIDPESSVQAKLLEDFTARFPDWRQNPYVKNSGVKYRLLFDLISKRRYKALNLLMRANQRLHNQ